eukprot:1080739-Pleurochrysis_carterae.AAC.1
MNSGALDACPAHQLLALERTAKATAADFADSSKACESIPKTDSPMPLLDGACYCVGGTCRYCYSSRAPEALAVPDDNIHAVGFSGENGCLPVTAVLDLLRFDGAARRPSILTRTAATVARSGAFTTTLS